MFGFIKKLLNIKSKDTSILTHEKQLDKDIQKTNINHPQKTMKTIPTIKMREGTEKAFVEIISTHFFSLGILSDKELDEIIKFIENVKGGFVNRHAWHMPIYDQYFKNREWSWPELSFWINYAKETGNYPKMMAKEWNILLHDNNLLKPDNIFDYMNSQDIRILLTECGIEFSCPKKGIKKYFESFLLENSDAFQAIKNKYIENESEYDKEEKREAMYSLLCATIEDRAMNLSRLREDAKLGITQHTEIMLCDADKDISEFGKKQNFTSVPPYVPGTSVVLRAIIPEFGDKA